MSLREEGLLVRGWKWLRYFHYMRTERRRLERCADFAAILCGTRTDSRDTAAIRDKMEKFKHSARFLAGLDDTP
jgi:hypothetical protein